MKNTTTRITSLDEHRTLLRSVFETARSRVLVVSPFISKTAIDHDRVPDLVHRATRRGVTVDIYTDNNLNLDASGALKTAAEAGVTSLLQAGAHVTIVRGIHNKTLARDNDLIAEGSFNWLSAVRTSGGTHQREERTLVVEGEQAKDMIDGETAILKKIGVGKELVNDSAARSKAFSKATYWWFLASYGATFVCMPPPAGQSFVGWYLFLLVPCGTLAVILAAIGTREVKHPVTPLVTESEKASGDDAPNCVTNSYGVTPTSLTVGLGIDEMN